MGTAVIPEKGICRVTEKKNRTESVVNNRRFKIGKNFGILAKNSQKFQSFDEKNPKFSEFLQKIVKKFRILAKNSQKIGILAESSQKFKNLSNRITESTPNNRSGYNRTDGYFFPRLCPHINYYYGWLTNVW